MERDAKSTEAHREYKTAPAHRHRAGALLCDPGSVLRVLRRAPAHVPLTFDPADPARAGEMWGGATYGDIARRMRQAGVNQRFVLAGHAGFFVVHRDAVERVCHLAFDFWQCCECDGLRLPCEPLLADAAQMLCGDPRLHHVSHAPDLWLPRTPRSEPGADEPALIGGWVPAC